MKTKQKPARSTTTKRYEGFTAEERSAMRARAKEMKVGADKAEAEAEFLAKIAAMTPADRALAERIHAIVTANAPDLAPRLWYGMPAYYMDGKLICHFQDAQKFKTAYATLGFSDKANLSEGTMWPVAFALTKLTSADEARIGALVKKAVS